MRTAESRSNPGSNARKSRSRQRILNAATNLLKSGGMDAVTVDAITRTSGVSRATLYRHFENTAQLRATALTRLLPPAVEVPADGALRARLIELVARQKTLIDSSPLYMTALTSIAMAIHSGSDPDSATLSRRIGEQYRRPFDLLFATSEAHAALGACDTTAAVTRLIGPIVFAKLIGLRVPDQVECIGLVDDFLTAHAAADNDGTV